MDERIHDILHELKERLRGLYGARLDRLVLFGSRARGDARDDSDIDVLVVLRGTVRAGAEIEFVGDAIADLSLKHDVLISCVFVSSSRYRRELSPLMLNVRREGLSV